MSDEIYANEPRQQMLKRQRRLLRWGIVVLVAGVIGIQLLPAGLQHNNPPVLQEPEWDEAATRALAVRACYDCHSNETLWPWYSYVAPISWMVLHDVHEGRKVLNFSEWTPEQIQRIKPEEAVEQVSKGLMPLPYYEILHPEATLSSEDQGVLINGLIETLTRGKAQELDTENLDEDK